MGRVTQTAKNLALDAVRVKLIAAIGLPALVIATVAVLTTTIILIVVIIFTAAQADSQQTTTPAVPSGYAVDDIPQQYFELYVKTGQQQGLDWAILAGIGKIESDHGRSPAPGIRSGVNSFGCCAGPMQFNIKNGSPSTWDTYGKASVEHVYDPVYAIPAAGRLLKANGAPGDYDRAIFAYNHADWYVRRVLANAARYRKALADAANKPAATDYGGGRLSWPLPPSTPVTSPFGPRGGRPHQGIDLGAKEGTPIHSAQTGTTRHVGWVTGYGNYICIAHTSQLSTCYAHLSRYTPGLKVGQAITQGETIGYVGNTGHSFGAHLHFEVRENGQPVNPAPYLK